MRSKSEIQRLKLSALTFDPQIYPRVDVSTQHVSEIAEAIRAGVKLPPIVVERKGLRIIDGVHRWRGHKTALGANAEIEAELRTYSSERQLFLDAVRLNADHGLPYNSFERTRNVLRAGELGIPEKEIAIALHIRVEKIEKLKLDKTAIGKGGQIALKRSMQWVGAGSTLTDAQAKANQTAGGMTPLYYINQLIEMLEAGLWDKGGEPVRVALEKLFAALARIRPAKKSA